VNQEAHQGADVFASNPPIFPFQPGETATGCRFLSSSLYLRKYGSSPVRGLESVNLFNSASLGNQDSTQSTLHLRNAKSSLLYMARSTEAQHSTRALARAYASRTSPGNDSRLSRSASSAGLVWWTLSAPWPRSSSWGRPFGPNKEGMDAVSSLETTLVSSYKVGMALHTWPVSYIRGQSGEE